MQKSRSSLTRRSRPPSQVRISRIRGEVDVRYVRCVKEFSRGSGDVVSSAVDVVADSGGVRACDKQDE